MSPGVQQEGSGGPRIDVSGMIHQASRRVHIDQLVKRGKKYISLLSKRKIDELINQAVRTTITKYAGKDLKGIDGANLEADAKRDFNELLAQYQEANMAKEGLTATHESLVNELDEMRSELEQQKQIADGKLDEEAEQMLIVGFKEFEQELDRIVGNVFAKRNGGPEAAESRLKAMVHNLVALERERFAGKFGQDRYVRLLERRIGKLSDHMAGMESALKMISNQKLFSNQQITNVLRELGLSPEDEQMEKKNEILKVVFDENVKLRRECKDLKATRDGYAA